MEPEHPRAREDSVPRFYNLRRWWSTWRRRIVLAATVTGLIIYLALLPPEARNSLLVSLLAQRTLIFLLLLFSGIVLSLLWTAGERFDAWVFLFINLRGYPLWLDRLMWAVTQLGNGLVALVAAAFAYFAGYRRLAVEVILGVLSLWLIVEIAKALTDRARPFLLLEDVRVIGWREPGLSFPSGHTAQVFFLVSFISRYFGLDPLYIFLLYLVAMLVGFTRMYVGAHYPRDVVAGALLGSVWGILMMLVDVYFNTRQV